MLEEQTPSLLVSLTAMSRLPSKPKPVPALPLLVPPLPVVPPPLLPAAPGACAGGAGHRRVHAGGAAEQQRCRAQENDRACLGHHRVTRR